MNPRLLGRLAAVAGLAAGMSLSAQNAAEQLVAGDYALRLGERGVEIRHGGEQLVFGSYFTVFKPGYQGSVLTSREAWNAAGTAVDLETKTATVQADLPGGRVLYAAAVTERGVTVTASVRTVADAEIGPVEYAVFQIPASLVEGGTVDVVNPAGAVVESKPVPAEPKRGSMCRNGDALVLRTARRNLVVSALSARSAYFFDARVPQYGDRQGLWAFSTIPIVPGIECVARFRFHVEQPEPPPVRGTVRFRAGAPVSVVATAPAASERERFAADELADYLERICGCRPKRVELDPAGVRPGVIAVGRLAERAGVVSRQELDDVRRDGYVVKVTDDRAGIGGYRDLGAIYGVHALLNRLGARFYAPGCEVVPAIAELVLPECELRATPVYELRKTTQNLELGHTPSDDLGNPRDLGESGGLVHAAAYLLPFDRFAEDHPEYFALQKDGRRLHRDPESRRFDVHLCLSNPDVKAISARRLLHLVERQSDRTFFGVSQGDGHAWCQCERCRARDAVPGKEMTDRLLEYVNHCARAVAASYPDKRILTLAYTNATSPPPVRVMPDPNVMVQFCPYPGRVACQSHPLTCPKNRRGYEDLQAWLRRCPDNMYIFDYPRGYKIWYEPFGSFYAMTWKLHFYAEHGVRGLYYCGVPTNFRDLFVFVQSRLHWEPDADVEALIDEFMAAYYGAAAPYVRRYFDYMHRQVEERDVHQMCEGANPGLVTADYADKALAWLGQAEAAVADDRPRRYRVRAETFSVLFADLNERNPVNLNLAVSEAVFAQRLAQFADIGRAMRIGSIGRREDGVVSDWLYRICRLRTQVKPWFADPLIDRLVRDPMGTLEGERQHYSQDAVDGGIRVRLDAFVGCNGPKEYSYNCPPREAAWIYGRNTRTPEMRAAFRLEGMPAERARLVLTAQDDDKPGAVAIVIILNEVEVFRGPSGFAQNGWSTRTFDVPADALRDGKNVLRIATLRDSPASDAGWFMLAECKLLFGK